MPNLFQPLDRFNMEELFGLAQEKKRSETKKLAEMTEGRYGERARSRVEAADSLRDKLAERKAFAQQDSDNENQRAMGLAAEYMRNRQGIGGAAAMAMAKSDMKGVDKGTFGQGGGGATGSQFQEPEDPYMSQMQKQIVGEQLRGLAQQREQQAVFPADQMIGQQQEIDRTDVLRGQRREEKIADVEREQEFRAEQSQMKAQNRLQVETIKTEGRRAYSQGKPITKAEGDTIDNLYDDIESSKLTPEQKAKRTKQISIALQNNVPLKTLVGQLKQAFGVDLSKALLPTR